MKIVRPQIGVKLGGLFYQTTEANSDLLKPLANEGLFFEYQAPNLCFEDIAHRFDLQIKSLRPHSVYLSMASSQTPASSMVNKLSLECKKTEAPYLGEHIGLLNLNPQGSSLGYLIAPALNQRTIDQIVQNILEMKKTIQIPIALENCVFYSCHEVDEMNYAQFLMQLSAALPQDVGWLIDFAHLEASCRNVGNCSVEEVLAVYKATGRILYEVHLANVYQDKNGVWHDDHNSIFQDGRLDDIIGSLNVHGLAPRSYTIERTLTKNVDVLELKSEIQKIKAILELERKPPVFFSGTSPYPATCMKAERTGRISILADRLAESIATIELQSLEKLAYDLGFHNFDDLIREFYDRPEEHSKGLPQFSMQEFDGVDILTPFYRFLTQLNHKTSYVSETLRKILFEIVIRQAVVVKALKAESDIQLLLSLAGNLDELEEGSYLISVDENWNVEAQAISIEDLNRETKNVALFTEKGGILWPMEQNELSEKMPSQPQLAAKTRIDSDAKMERGVG